MAMIGANFDNIFAVVLLLISIIVMLFIPVLIILNILVQ